MCDVCHLRVSSPINITMYYLLCLVELINLGHVSKVHVYLNESIVLCDWKVKQLLCIGKLLPLLLKEGILILKSLQQLVTWCRERNEDHMRLGLATTSTLKSPR